MAALWTASQEVEFHQAIGRLSKLRQTLGEEIDYRQKHRDNPRSSAHILRLEDELQLADHIAFLAHTSEGPLEIAAVCIEEQKGTELVIRIARNQLQHAKDIQRLGELVQLVERCARNEIDANSTQDNLFAKVLDISEHRLLQRLMPPWYPPPQHWTMKQMEKRTSLYRRVKTVLLPTLSHKMPSSLHQRLSQAAETLEPLEKKKVGSELRQLLKSAVLSCFDICASTENRSLELHLGQSIHVLPDIGRKTVFQIDKIARYFSLCRDLVKMVTNKKYRSLFQQITLKPILSHQLIRPRGSTGLCVTHAEVQLILHYERSPACPQPRAIGCSKSACFLCDLLIRYHGKFHISLSHQRLYPKWTIPDNSWMTLEQVRNWRSLITSMVREMQGLIQKYNLQRGNALTAPVESKACLPLISVVGSVETLVVPIIGIDTNEPLVDEALSNQKERSLLSGCSSAAKEPIHLMLSAKNLPFTYNIPTACPGFRLSLDEITVIFECSRGYSGTIRLERPYLPSPSIGGVEIEDLSCVNDLKIVPKGGDEGLAMMLRAGGRNMLQVEVRWSS